MQAVQDFEDLLQLGVAPNRIDLLLDPGGRSGLSFAEAWEHRVQAPYGSAAASWMRSEKPLSVFALRECRP